MTKILEALIYASERAAKIARSCCTDSAKETLLVAEKCGGEANSRFDKDFKTIADVLAQESARNEIALRCPELAKQLRGEECAELNGVTIRVCDTEEQTAELLATIVPAEAAKSMATAAHEEISMSCSEFPDIDIDLDLGIWIDPIDATAEFIAGVCGEAKDGHGLPCVTVLIGAYKLSTGEPVIGVINQPFTNNGEGNIIWGYCYGDTRIHNVNSNPAPHSNKTVLMSAAENPAIIDKFKSSGWEVKSYPGAGNKLRKVAAGEAEAYIVSKGTTFRWDTCAPHAILKAKGGDIVSYSTHIPITYNDPNGVDTQQYANSGGIIAYTNQQVFQDLIKNINS